MGPEPRVVQLLDRVLHVVTAQELDHPGAVLVRVRKADVARLPHVILQVLPRAGVGQPRHQHTVLGPFGARTISTTSTAASSVLSATTSAASPTFTASVSTASVATTTTAGATATPAS